MIGSVHGSRTRSSSQPDAENLIAHIIGGYGSARARLHPDMRRKCEDFTDSRRPGCLLPYAQYLQFLPSSLLSTVPNSLCPPGGSPALDSFFHLLRPVLCTKQKVCHALYRVEHGRQRV